MSVQLDLADIAEMCPPYRLLVEAAHDVSPAAIRLYYNHDSISFADAQLDATMLEMYERGDMTSKASDWSGCSYRYIVQKYARAFEIPVSSVEECRAMATCINTIRRFRYCMERTFVKNCKPDSDYQPRDDYAHWGVKEVWRLEAHEKIANWMLGYDEMIAAIEPSIANQR